MSETRSHRTTILIDDDLAPRDDWKWLSVRGLKPTNLLRKKIKEMREAEQFGNINYKEANEKIHKRLEALCRAMEDTLNKKQFDEIMRKI